MMRSAMIRPGAAEFNRETTRGIFPRVDSLFGKIGLSTDRGQLPLRVVTS
jgi:hypothetical protein